MFKMHKEGISNFYLPCDQAKLFHCNMGENTHTVHKNTLNIFC